MQLTKIISLALFAIIGANAFAVPDDVSELVKRKGGGGGKGGGTSSGGGGKTGGTSGGSSGAPKSGVTPSYGGGSYYGGGSRSAYAAGGRSPLGLLPLGILPLAALGFFAGAWLFPVYQYPYSHPYSFRNQTANQNQTKNVLCLCQQYSDCGCDDNTNSTFLDPIIGNGNPSQFNQSLVRVANINGTDTIVLNGTLPNGTSDTSDTSTSAASGKGMGASWALGWLVFSAVTFLVL